MIARALWSSLFGLAVLSTAAIADVCPDSTEPYLQVLGSGGPELQDKRASASYVVWVNGKAVVLVDMGGGSALRFGQAGADSRDLQFVLFSHFHADHSADFPALIKSSWFKGRQEMLPVFGPSGNDFMPSTEAFINGLFDAESGPFRYLSDFIDPAQRAHYRLAPASVETPGNEAVDLAGDGPIRIRATEVHHGPIPAVAWRVQVGDRSVTFSGDMSERGAEPLVALAKNSDILVAHNAVPEGAVGVALRLHMPPSVVGKIAAAANVGHLVLSHRMLRTIGREEETLTHIRRAYDGKISFADDLSCFAMLR